VSKKRKSGTRFPLLVYRQLFRARFWPSALAFVSLTALMVWNPSFLSESRSPLLPELRWWFLPVVLVAAGLMVHALLARYTTYVQAHPRALRIKTPLFPLVISYGRINIVRTTQFRAHFPPESLPWPQRQLATKLYGHTCLVIETKGYPLPRRLLSLLLNRFLLPQKTMGVALLVEDWLQLSNEIESARADWVNRRLIKREQRMVEKILRK